MNTIRHLAVAALGMSVLALAGCPEAEVDPEPSITFAGIADYAAITEGGSATIYWQTRLADEVRILADGTTPLSLDSCIPNLGRGGLELLGTEECEPGEEGCECDPVTGEDCVRPRADDDPNDCLLTGALEVSPTAELTSYTVQAIRGAGDCSRREGIGDLINPEQCEEWGISPLEVAVLPASTAAFEAETLNVTSGAATTVAFTTTNAGGVEVGIYDDSVDPATTTYCEPADSASAEAVCTYTLNEDGTGTVDITVTEDTTLILEVTNGADDGAGDSEDMIDLVVGLI